MLNLTTLYLLFIICIISGIIGGIIVAKIQLKDANYPQIFAGKLEDNTTDDIKEAVKYLMPTDSLIQYLEEKESDKYD